MTLHMVIGDSHAKPDVSNDRFLWAGRMALDRRPDVIIDIGDWADMPSLSSYDKGKKAFEGRRYSRDITACIEARGMFESEIDAYNTRRAGNGKRQYRPRKVGLLGNHEQRIERAVELSPELEGTIGYDDLGHTAFGWERHPYLQQVAIDGVHYSHYFPSGIKCNPIGGEHPAATLLKKQFVSCVVGHSHIRDFSERTRADGKRLCSLVAGCYFEHREEYAGPANDMWWRGIVFLHDVHDGVFDPEFVSIDTIKRMYA